MRLDARQNSLIQKMIRTERYRRQTHLRDELRKAQGEASTRGTLGAGFYAAAQEDRCAAEYESRAADWLELTSQIIEQTSTPWSEELAKEVEFILREELNRDWNELVEQCRAVVKPHGHTHFQGRLDASQNRARDRIENQLELRILREDKTRLPLMDQLSAPRYKSVSGLWLKANGFLDGPGIDFENAAKEAVSAVEALGRLVVDDVGAKLGDAIKKLRADGRVPAPLLKGLEELWGYTSNQPNVRHGGGKGQAITSAQARYVVECAGAALRLLLQYDVP